MRVAFILEVYEPKETVLFIYLGARVLSGTGCLRSVKTSLMFLDISTVTVFLDRLLEGHSLVLRAIWV
jgi:hypothetical protein